MVNMWHIKRVGLDLRVCGRFLYAAVSPLCVSVAVFCVWMTRCITGKTFLLLPEMVSDSAKRRKRNSRTSLQIPQNTRDRRWLKWRLSPHYVSRVAQGRHYLCYSYTTSTDCIVIIKCMPRSAYLQQCTLHQHPVQLSMIMIKQFP